MSTELSRVKSRQKQKIAEGPQSGKRKRGNSRSEKTARRSKPSETAAPSLSRSTRRQASNVNKEQNEENVPSRSDKYSFERVRLSKMFVNSLISIFIVLLVALLWWGIEGAPPLNTLW